MRFEAPTSIDDAVALLAAEAGTTRLLAGGTDVLVQLRSGVVEPDLVVDVKRIPGIGAITREEGGWRVGAAVPAVEMKEDAALAAAWPGVVEAANLIGSTPGPQPRDADRQPLQRLARRRWRAGHGCRGRNGTCPRAERHAGCRRRGCSDWPRPDFAGKGRDGRFDVSARPPGAVG